MNFADSRQILQVATVYPFKKRNRMWILQDIRNRMSAPAIYTKSYVSSCNVYEVVYIALFFLGDRKPSKVCIYSDQRGTRRKNAVTFVFLRVVRSEFQDLLSLSNSLISGVFSQSEEAQGEETVASAAQG